MDMKNQDIAYFLSFCIEQYKNAKGMNGAEVLETFAKYGVLDYLNNHFEILHTQSRQWILEDIDEYINIKETINNIKQFLQQDKFDNTLSIVIPKMYQI